MITDDDKEELEKMLKELVKEPLQEYVDEFINKNLNNWIETKLVELLNTKKFKKILRVILKKQFMEISDALTEVMSKTLDKLILMPKESKKELSKGKKEIRNKVKENIENPFDNEDIEPEEEESKNYFS